MTKASDVRVGHGRLEPRSACVISEPDVIATLNERGCWAAVRCVALVAAERTVNGPTTTEQRFSLLNRIVAATTLNTMVRGDWGLDNQVHWVLDVVVHADASRIRTGDAPQHMGIVRDIALNLLRHEPSTGSLKPKRFRAALDEAYLAQVLGL